MHCPYEEQDFLVGVAEALAVAVAPEGVLAASVCCLSIDLFQLFFDVTTKTRPGTKVTFCSHTSGIGFHACSETVSVRSKVFPHFSQRY
jgi:hypothetical protein